MQRRPLGPSFLLPPDDGFRHPHEAPAQGWRGFDLAQEHGCIEMRKFFRRQTKKRHQSTAFFDKFQ